MENINEVYEFYNNVAEIDQRERFKAQEALLAQVMKRQTQLMRTSSMLLKSVCRRQEASVSVLTEWLCFLLILPQFAMCYCYRQ